MAVKTGVYVLGIAAEPCSEMFTVTNCT